MLAGATDSSHSPASPGSPVQRSIGSDAVEVCVRVQQFVDPGMVGIPDRRAVRVVVDETSVGQLRQVLVIERDLHGLNVVRRYRLRGVLLAVCHLLGQIVQGYRRILVSEKGENASAPVMAQYLVQGIDVDLLRHASG